MKLLLLLCLTLSSVSTLRAQTPSYFGTSGTSNPTPAPTAPVAPTMATDTKSKPIPTPRSQIVTEDGFRAFLVGTTWSWFGSGHESATLTFYADGTARNSYGWTAKYVIKNITEIQLQLKGRTAKMTFDQTYTHYDGIDFNKMWPLKGQREK